MKKKFPFYRQLDQMDCGPTCLKMIAKFHGKYFPITYIKRKTYFTNQGVSLLGISDGAEALGFRTSGYQLNYESLQEISLPCIAHWRQNHFVVIYKIKKDSVYIADPAHSLMKYSKDEFIKGWINNKAENGAGLVLTLEPTPVFYSNVEEIKDESKNRFSTVFYYLKNYKKLIYQLIIGLLIGSLIQLILPFLTQSIVDVGINARDTNFIYLILIGQLMLFLGRTTVEVLRRWILLHLSTRINISMISDFLLKLLKLPLAFFDGKLVGDLLQRIDDYKRIERFLSTSSLGILFSLFNLIIFGVVLLIYDLEIFLVFFTLSVIYIIYTLLFLSKRADLDYRKFRQLSLNHSNLIELIYGMADIKLNNSETVKRWEWERIQSKLYRVNIKSTKLHQIQDIGGGFINEIKNILITILSAFAVLEGDMTLGMMLAVQYIIGQLNGPISEFINFTLEWQDAKISFDRINEIHRLENEEKSTHLVEDISVFESDITIENLSFNYSGPNDPLILDQLSFNIPHNKVTAIVGVSGSGKTTLMKLLLKFYEPLQGSIHFSGIKIKNISAKKWRSQCGVVMQDGYIFSDSILKNITLDDSYSHERLIKSAEISNILDFVEALPNGFETKIGKDGLGLSVGQKQRILIARAIYKYPKFIFLDEATSSLDANNESEIVGKLNSFFENRTVVIIAHRLSTVKNADQIIVLDKGRIVEVGDHKSLSLKKGAYYQLVKNQLELGT